ncbi:phosphatidylserine decarboxylase 1 [Sporothrix stenoceras]|uniref:Phosphatidylserine decarboxylase proenzyme 1, mitochondrial n=1 Tax=Sporothrix stenoceras TaxID=5173 RepID=A0ABR3ZIH0_9PEZI
MASAPSRLGLSRGSFSKGITTGRFSVSLSERQILFNPPRRLVINTSPFRFYSQKAFRRPRFSARLRHALKNSKIQWYRIPVGLGIGFLGLVQFYKVRNRQAAEENGGEGAVEAAQKPKKRPRIRPDGPWQVQVMSTLPLKALSRLWGRFNELTLPYYLRVPGIKLYSYAFGVNLSEVEEPDLHKFPNLAAFFYRTLKPGVRPIDPNHSALTSPSDGRILQFGKIEGGDIEQVKGMTYSLDALLGKHTPAPSIINGQPSSSASSTSSSTANLRAASTMTTTAASNKGQTNAALTGDEELVRADEEFAQVNGISYTLPGLISGPDVTDRPETELEDQSVRPSAKSISEVQADLDLPWYTQLLSKDKKSALYYAVIYLAPGDYHRFHSPTNWVVERRRHFAGELYSVSPYLQRTLPGLFTLNERVVLLGRWRWGFFSYIPVGATNVGSIKVNFDRELRTNSLTTDTAADRAAEEAAQRGEAYSGFAEATYAAASPVLHGHALRRGEEMGGFQLGSTVVLVFEAPEPDTLGVEPGAAPDKSTPGWHWAVEKGQKIKMGEALGFVNE